MCVREFLSHPYCLNCGYGVSIHILTEYLISLTLSYLPTFSLCVCVGGDFLKQRLRETKSSQ